MRKIFGSIFLSFLIVASAFGQNDPFVQSIDLDTLSETERRLSRLELAFFENESAFLAISPAEQSNIAKDTDVTVIVTEIFDRGSAFASNTFTASDDGGYVLSGFVHLKNIDVAATNYIVKIVTSNRSYEYNHAITNDTTRMLGLSILADMDANDTAILKVYQTGGTGGTVDLSNGQAYFSGYRVF